MWAGRAAVAPPRLRPTARHRYNTLAGTGSALRTRMAAVRLEQTPMRGTLPSSEVEGWVNAHPRWKFSDGKIRKKYVFRSFRSAIVFVNRVATISDELDHHPEIRVNYSEVVLRLWSHDADGVTERDLKLAERIDFATSAR
ncbi:MAG: 4a-hydroxytetrahydrobiopterin dehydratase [Gemmatimonadetes bacterium]|nr:4a-hydroxytetrahydrobiopterin dehydratase [Gemmatimonadota bacterium]